MELNWLWRLYIYGTVCVLVGPFYDNWTSMEKYLYLGGAYVNECPDHDPNTVPVDTWLCDAQQEKVSMLLTVARASECSFSVIIGIFMDRVGPKITATVGVILRMIGWTLIGFAVHWNAALVTGLALLGITVNFIVFPALTVGLYTKKYRFIAIVQIGMSSCFASLIIMIKVAMIQAGWLSYTQINYLYSILMLVPSLLISAIFFPYSLERQDLEKACEKENPVAIADFDVVPPSSSETSSIINAPETHLHRSSSLSGLEQEHGDGHIYQKDSINTSDFEDHRQKWSWSGFFRTLMTKEAITCLFYFAFNFGSITFIQQSYTVMYGKNPLLLRMSEYLLPMAFIPCLVFSVLYMYAQPIWILIGINALGALMHAIATINSPSAGVMLCIALVIVYSILNTKVYNYLDKVFDEIYMGSIVGALNTMCGVWLLIQGLVLNGRTDAHSLLVINYSMMTLRLLFLAPFLYFAFEKHGHKDSSMLSLPGSELNITVVDIGA